MMFIPTREQYNDAINALEKIDFAKNYCDEYGILYYLGLLDTFEAIYPTRTDYLKAV